MRERYEREAMASAFRILGEGQLSLTKFLLVTDRPVDLRDFPATLEHVLARTRPETDLFVFANLSMDTLDYTGPAVNEGWKGVLLGLGEPVRELPREFRPAVEPPAGTSEVRVFCPGCLVVGGPAYAAEAGRRRPASPPTPPSPAGRCVVLTDEPRRAAAEPDQLPVDHLHPLRARRRPPRRRRPAWCATTSSARRRSSSTRACKPGFPAELACDPDTAATVDPPLARVLPRRRRRDGRLRAAHLDPPLSA